MFELNSHWTIDGTPRYNLARYANHSCNPNAEPIIFRKRVFVRALRRIKPGEEITYDYAMSDGSPYDEFNCSCGSPHCRGHVSGEDWRRTDLWLRYAGYFSPYLQRRIMGAEVLRVLQVKRRRGNRKLAAAASVVSGQ